MSRFHIIAVRDLCFEDGRTRIRGLAWLRIRARRKFFDYTVAIPRLYTIGVRFSSSLRPEEIFSIVAVLKFSPSSQNTYFRFHLPDMPSKETSALFRIQLLALLAIQNTSVILVTHYASIKEPGQTSSYSTSSAIFVVELTKCLICIAVITYTKGFQGLVTDINESVIKRPQSFLALAIPSFLYVIQNNLNMVAIGNLPPAIYTVVYQLKVFSAAIINVIVFRRVLGTQKWMAICFLFVGVTLAQWKGGSKESEDSNETAGMSSYVIGLVCACCATVTSGVAGTFMEWIMKQTQDTSKSDVLHTWEPSMWTKNIGLAFFGVIGSTFAMIADRAKIGEFGMLNGFKPSLWVAISLQAGGGLLVGAVLKYADNIIKGFVTSVGVILASLASVYLFDFQITLNFLVGAIIVFASLHVYNSKRDFLREFGIGGSSVAVSA